MVLACGANRPKRKTQPPKKLADNAEPDVVKPSTPMVVKPATPMVVKPATKPAPRRRSAASKTPATKPAADNCKQVFAHLVVLPVLAVLAVLWASSWMRATHLEYATSVHCGYSGGVSMPQWYSTSGGVSMPQWYSTPCWGRPWVWGCVGSRLWVVSVTPLLVRTHTGGLP